MSEKSRKQRTNTPRSLLFLFKFSQHHFSLIYIYIYTFVFSENSKRELKKMHALSLKALTGFNATRRESCSCVEYEHAKRRVGFNWGCKDLTRTSGVVACVGGGGGGGGGESLGSKSGAGGSSGSSPSSLFSRSQTYALLKQQMEVAAKSEVIILFIFC